MNGITPQAKPKYKRILQAAAEGAEWHTDIAFRAGLSPCSLGSFYRVCVFRGWFEKIGEGRYKITALGRKALVDSMRV